MVSLRNSAESTPEVSTSNASNRRGVCAWRSIRPVTTVNSPARRRFAFTIIIANNSTRVSMSTAAAACCGVSAPRASSAAAPTSAMVARFMRTHG